MIIEISHFLSILATGLFLLVGYFSILTPSSNSSYISNLIFRMYSHGFFFLLSSFLIYVWLAITDNFSVQYIANHSNTALPIFYKISSIWSAHEGSMFLWIVFLSLWGFLFNIRVKNTEVLKKTLEHFDIIYKDIISIFNKNNITLIESINKKLDPNLHQAMMEIEDDNKEPGTIIQEIQKGFMLKDRLLRPSLVGVAKKTTPKDEKTEENKQNLKDK